MSLQEQWSSMTLLRGQVVHCLWLILWMGYLSKSRLLFRDKWTSFPVAKGYQSLLIHVFFLLRMNLAASRGFQRWQVSMKNHTLEKFVHLHRTLTSAVLPIETKTVVRLEHYPQNLLISHSGIAERVLNYIAFPLISIASMSGIPVHFLLFWNLSQKLRTPLW